MTASFSHTQKCCVPYPLFLIGTQVYIREEACERKYVACVDGGKTYGTPGSSFECTCY